MQRAVKAAEIMECEVVEVEERKVFF